MSSMTSVGDVVKDLATEASQEAAALLEGTQEDAQTAAQTQVPTESRQLTSKELKTLSPKEVKPIFKTEKKREASPTKKAEEFANKYKDSKFSSGQLKDLHDELEKQGDDISEEDILELIKEKLKDPTPSDPKHVDPTYVDEALKFLLDTTDGKVREKVISLQQKYEGEHRKEIIGGRAAGQQFAEAPIKDIAREELRDLYRGTVETVHTKPTIDDLFKNLSDKYPTPEKLDEVIKFILGAATRELKEKATSIEPGLLHSLMTASRGATAVSFVYTFFTQRVPLMKKMIAANSQGEDP